MNLWQNFTTVPCLLPAILTQILQFIGIAQLHEVGQVMERRYTGKTARFKARIPPQFHHEFAKFIVE